MNELLLTSIIVISGIGGGLVNLAMNQGEELNIGNISRSIVLGIGASFLMPLFLKTISSTMLEDVLDDDCNAEDIFVFAGFCLLGAISSRALIQNLTSKLLQKAQETADEAKVAVDRVNATVAPLIEDEEQENFDENDIDVSEEQVKVLSALQHKRFMFRTLGGLSGQVAMERAVVSKILTQLLEKELIKQVNLNSGVHWALSGKGTRFLEVLKDKEIQ